MTTAAPPRGRGAVTRAPGPAALLARLASPVTEYYVLLTTTLVLVGFGLVMVLSASSAASVLKGEPWYAGFARQTAFAIAGTIGCLLASRVSIAWWKRLSFMALLGAVGLQLMVFVPGIGYSQGGNRNWIKFGPITGQPSEIAKIALVLVGAMMLANKRRLLHRYRHAVFPYVVPIAAITIGLVLAGKDLGTGFVLFGIVAAVLFVGGVPGRLFGVAGAAVVGVTMVMVKMSDNRMARITNWLSPDCNTDPDGACGQAVHGLYALADGGWWGVGLGASREKRGWLPEAQNDFIFAIIGEELGLPGTLLVLALFAVLAWVCFRIVTRADDQFVRIASAGVMAWIMVQTMINIGAVIGLLPVIGVNLPLVSAGGSSLVTTLIALGMVLSFARRLPGAAPLLADRAHPVRRSLAILPGRGLRRRR